MLDEDLRLTLKNEGVAGLDNVSVRAVEAPIASPHLFVGGSMHFMEFQGILLRVFFILDGMVPAVKSVKGKTTTAKRTNNSVNIKRQLVEPQLTNSHAEDAVLESRRVTPQRKVHPVKIKNADHGRLTRSAQKKLAETGTPEKLFALDSHSGEVTQLPSFVESTFRDEGGAAFHPFNVVPMLEFSATISSPLPQPSQSLKTKKEPLSLETTATVQKRARLSIDVIMKCVSTFIAEMDSLSEVPQPVDFSTVCL